MREGHGATGFLYHPATGKVLLHHRDAQAPSFPDGWHSFGGGAEPEDGGDLAATWRRELWEELGITVAAAQVVPIYDHVTPFGLRA